MADEDLIKAALPAFSRPFAGLIRIETEDGSAFWVDGRETPPKLSATAPAPACDSLCVWRAARDTLLRIFEEERYLAAAYISGRLALGGDMSVMARLMLEGERT